MSTLIPWPQTNPPIGFSNYTFKLSRKTIILRSPFDGTRQALVAPYALWALTGKFSRQVLNSSGSLRSFLSQLDGQANKFKLPLFDAAKPLSGYNGNTGFVNGASQTGFSLVTNGWAINTLILSDGDYFVVNDETKIVNGYVVSDGSGNATINFKPALRKSPANNLQLFIGNQVNLLSYSNVFGDASWFKQNCTVAASVVTDPDGGMNATKVIRTATGNFYVSKQITKPTIYGTNYTFSIWLRLGTVTGNITLSIIDFAGNNVSSVSITPSTSWIRYSVTGSLPIGAPLPMQIEINPQNMAGSAGDFFIIYEAQHEQGNAPTAYKNQTTGDGQPYCIMSSNSDDAASWDLSPPIQYDVQLDAIESVE